MKDLSFDEYSKRALATALNLNKEDFIYPVLGIAGEAGEIAEKFKKIIRDKNGIISDEDKVLIAKEIGDQLWYLNRLAWGLGYKLQDIAKMNIEKLEDRKRRGVIGGTGDSR